MRTRRKTQTEDAHQVRLNVEVDAPILVRRPSCFHASERR